MRQVTFRVVTIKAVSVTSKVAYAMEAVNRVVNMDKAADAADAGTADAATDAADVPAKATVDVANAANVPAKTTATHVAATAAAARFRGARQQGRGNKGRCQYREKTFHRDTPFLEGSARVYAM
jgi:hypothetical protein